MTRYKVCPNQLNIKKVVVVVGQGGVGGGVGEELHRLKSKPIFSISYFHIFNFHIFNFPTEISGFPM